MMPEEIDIETKYSIIKKLITFDTYTNYKNKLAFINKNDKTNKPRIY